MYEIPERSRLVGRDLIYLALSLKNRISGNFDNSIVLCNSYPKSGTHLLSQILLETKGAEYWNDIISVQSLSGVMNSRKHLRWKLKSAPGGSLVRSHLMHDPVVLDILSSRSMKKFFIYRDLRDVAVSHANWVLKEPRIYLHQIYKQLPSFEACLSASIVGTPIGSPFASNLSQPSIAQDFQRWKGWLHDETTFAVRFEDLVGGRGGGNEKKRLESIDRIFDHLELSMSLIDIEKGFSSEKIDPRKSHTFRKGNKGGIGTWREKFSEKNKEEMKAVAGDLLIELGYEDDKNW